MRLVVLVGRVCFAVIFILAAFNNFTPAGVAYAAQHGVPSARVLVPLAGVLSLVGGLSVLFGYKARWGALALIAFLIPVTLTMHNFWAVTDPAMAQLQRVEFFKNLSMFGGALLVYYFGAGPVSVDAWLEERPTAVHLTPRPTH
jgi:putative oxidoreductase